jgi:hypothetical protein
MSATFPDNENLSSDDINLSLRGEIPISLHVIASEARQSLGTLTQGLGHRENEIAALRSQ